LLYIYSFILCLLKESEREIRIIHMTQEVFVEKLITNNSDKQFNKFNCFFLHLMLQVKMVLDSLKENRKIAAATHNIIAYR